MRTHPQLTPQERLPKEEKGLQQGSSRAQAAFPGCHIFKWFLHSTYFQNRFEVKIWFRWKSPTTNCINHCLALNVTLWFLVSVCSSWYPREKGQQYPGSPHSLHFPRLDCHRNQFLVTGAQSTGPEHICHYLYGNVFKFSDYVVTSKLHSATSM